MLLFISYIVVTTLTSWLVPTSAATVGKQTVLESLVNRPLNKTLSHYVTGIGLDLTSNYGTVSITFANGSHFDVAKIEGSEEYCRTLYKLSLHSSQHPTPPYDSYEDMIRDAPRQTERRERKAQGLAASEDVERLADMISALLYRAEEFLGHKVTSALAATPNLVALYREDLEDAFEYIEVKSLDEPNGLLRLFRETAAVQGHYGFGLCQDPFEPAVCLDEIRKMDSTDVLTILYTKQSLCLEVCVMNSAYSIYPYPIVPTSMDFTLGSDAIGEGPNDEYFWEAVRERISVAIAAALPYRRPTRVFLMGESIDSARLRQILSDTLVLMLGYMPEVYEDEPVYAASSGAAEFARRGGYRWNTSDPVRVS